MTERRDATTTHDHPACKTERHRHEKAYVESTVSNSTEGCARHYDERIVSEDSYDTISDEQQLSFRKEELKRYIVMSELLSAPRCKKR